VSLTIHPPEPRDGEDAYFELSFSPNVKLVSTVRRFVGQFYSEVLADPEATSQLAVATHELLENAVRYSLDGNTSVRIGIRRVEDGTVVTLETCNRAAPQNLDTIRSAIDEIAGAPDADAHYQVLMRRTAKREGSSGLGLGRVRAETGMTLTHSIDGANVVVRAEARIARRTK
jgi:anti-sigma regulatory factor (Ser/Thr protein kinase)